MLRALRLRSQHGKVTTMSIMKDLGRYAPHGMLRWAFLDTGFNVWAEAQLGEGEPVKAHKVIPIDAGDMRFGMDMIKVIKDLIAKTRRV